MFINFLINFNKYNVIYCKYKMKVLFNFLIKFLFAGIFMNFGFPELIYQYNKFKFSDSLLYQIKSLDLEDFELNLNKSMDNNGQIVTKKSDDLFIKKNYPKYKR